MPESTATPDQRLTNAGGHFLPVAAAPLERSEQPKAIRARSPDAPFLAAAHQTTRFLLVGHSPRASAEQSRVPRLPAGCRRGSYFVGAQAWLCSRARARHRQAGRDALDGKTGGQARS